MSLKKKLGLGMASAALGLSLVGGGTFAYFNDTEVINNSFATGQLDLSVTNGGQPKVVNFDLSNLKPGDSIERYFILTAANGTEAIRQVLMNLTADNFVDGTWTDNSEAAMKEFLDQFRVELFSGVTSEPDRDNLLEPGKVLTLKDLYNNNYDAIVDSAVERAFDGNGNQYGPTRINIAESGLSIKPDPADMDGVLMKIKFHDNGQNQNKFQNDSVKVYFNLEGTQFEGTSVGQKGSNGSIEVNKELQFDNADGSDNANRTVNDALGGTDGNGVIADPVTEGSDNNSDQ